MLENANIFAGAVTPDATANFKRCVRPVINEKALEPSQVTLFQSIYQQDQLRRSIPTQFVGQTTNWVTFKGLEAALLGLKHKDRIYS